MDNSTPRRKIRVAVVGSGLAGLTAAYLLSRDSKKRYSVEIFETVSGQVHHPVDFITILIGLTFPDLN